MKTIFLKHKEWNNYGPITLTIGNFDGIHLGHAKLINTVKSFNDTKHGALTFNPHPQSFLRGNKAYTLMDVDVKINEFEKFELDYLFIGDFNEKLASLTIDEFINNLKDLGVIRLVLGRDFRFATKGSGKIADLEKAFEVIVLDDILYKNTRISTTYIKDLLKLGNLEEASLLLNKHYYIEGLVEIGNQVGTLMGFPTANLDYNNYYLPKNGVYYTEVLIDGVIHYGITNIGYNPTVNYSVTKKLETYIIDYKENLYNKKIRVTFIKYLRPEEKFDSIDALISQMNQDKITVLDIINNKNMLK